MIHVYNRHYGCRISDNYTYFGLRTIILENGYLRIGILVDKGTDIFEFLHKPSDTDFLWRSPIGIRNPGPDVPSSVLHESSFHDYYEGGWQEIFPNGGESCEYKGTQHGLHGELWARAWDYEIITDTAEKVEVKFNVRTILTPFYIEKTLRIEKGKPVLFIDEKVINEGSEEMDFMWGHHVAFGQPFLDNSCVIDIAGAGIEVDDNIEPTCRLSPGSKSTWPYIVGRNDKTISLAQLPKSDAGISDMVYLTDIKEGWFTITNTSREVGFGLYWSKDVFRHIWYWLVCQGSFGYPWYGRTYNIALEPFSSYPERLTESIKRKTQLKLGPGCSISASLKAVVYTGVKGVENINSKGEVTPRL